MNLTLDKGLRVLECLSATAEPMSVGEIAQEIGTNPSTAYRLLDTLKKRGYIEQEYNRADYRAGLRVLQLSANILNKMELRRKAGPYLHALSEKTDCDIYLAAANNGQAVMIMTYHPGGRMRTELGSIGSVSSFYYTAMGKCIAAFSPEETVKDFLASEPLAKRTEHTITSKQKLMAEYKTTRETGLSRSRYENSPDIHGIAVPVRNYEGEVVASLGLALTIGRDTKERMDEYEQALRESGEQLSFAIGYAAAQLV
jgi:DNA-binding IclR family transcriptional regulator